MNQNRTLTSKSCHVLLIDDSDDIAALVKAHLNDPNVNVTVTANGRDGIEAFKQSAFDLVLMDLHMPGMDGFETTRAIRFWERQNDRRPTPIAALTAASSTSALSEVYGSGCTHYLAKPITRNVLLQTVSQYFSSVRAAATGA